MKVPLLDLKAQLETIGKDLKCEVEKVIDSTQYILGTRVSELEERVAEFTGARFAIGVSSGTDALLACLMALDVGPGDLVLTTSYSFFASGSCAARLGATPVFLDIDPETYNLCPAQLSEWLERRSTESARVKAILPVHLYGQCAEMDPILATAAEYGIPVIEDAAQAIGATYSHNGTERMAGTLGLAGCFSFFPTKNLGGIGDGGMIVTNDADLARKLELLRGHGAEPKFYHALVGGNFRLDPIQAAALSVKLPYLDSWNALRRTRAEYYDRAFEGSGVITPRVAYSREAHVYHQYVISVPEKRHDLQTFLTENEIGSSVYYPVPLHLQECFADLGYRPGDLPHSEYAADHTLALPIYPELTSEMQDQVVDRIGAFYA